MDPLEQTFLSLVGDNRPRLPRLCRVHAPPPPPPPGDPHPHIPLPRPRSLPNLHPRSPPRPLPPRGTPRRPGHRRPPHHQVQTPPVRPHTLLARRPRTPRLRLHPRLVRTRRHLGQ